MASRRWNKLFFGSDDGFLYSLNLASGQLRWKFRAAPHARRIPGNKSAIPHEVPRVADTGVQVLGRLLDDRLISIGGVCLTEQRPHGGVHPAVLQSP